MRLTRRVGVIVLVAMLFGCGDSNGVETGTEDPLPDRGTEDSAGSGGQSEGNSDDLIQAATVQFEYNEPAHLGLIVAMRRSDRHGTARRLYGNYVIRMGELDVEPDPFAGSSHS